MSNASKRFRDRALDCLNLSKGAKHEADRTMLEDIAADLVAEAKLMEAEERAKEGR